MEWLGASSGAVTGFLLDNTRGGVYGWRAGRILGRRRAKLMAPIRSRSRSRSRGRHVRPRVGPSSSSPVAMSISRGRSFPRSTSRLRSRALSRTRSRSRARSFSWGSSGGGVGETHGGFEGTTSSGFRMKRRGVKKFLKGYKKLLGTRYVDSVCTTEVDVGNGVQTPAVLNSVATTSTNINTSLLAFDHLTTLFTQLGIDEAPTTPTVGSLARRMYIASAHVKYRMRNQTSGPLTLTIYDLLCRRDRTTNVVAQTDWAQGLVDERDPASSVIAGETLLGAKPFESEKFCINWHVKRVSTRIVHAGSEHVHTIDLKLNKLVNRAMLTTGTNLFGGLTYQCMVIIQGPIARDSMLPFGVGTAFGRLDVVAETRTKCFAMEKSRTVISNFNVVSSTTTTNQQITEDTDQDLPVDRAG